MTVLHFSEFLALLALEGRNPPARPLIDVTGLAIGDAKPALIRQLGWQAVARPTPQQFQPTLYRSPRGIFTVSFQPQYEVAIEPHACAIHVWHEAQPLQKRIVDSALTLIAESYQTAGAPPDIGVLMLNDDELHRLSDARVCSTTAFELVRQLENLIVSR